MSVVSVVVGEDVALEESGLESCDFVGFAR